MNKDKFTRRWVYPYVKGKVRYVGENYFDMVVTEHLGNPVEDGWIMQLVKPAELELKPGEVMDVGYCIEPKKVVGEKN